MPTLTISPTYSDGVVLTAAQIDTLVDPITTFVNTTKLDSANVDLDNVVAGVSSSEAAIVLNKAGVGNVTTAFDSSTSLTTTYATVVTVVAPTAGDYLITASGIASIERTTTTFVTVWGGALYVRLYNSTTTTAIGPEGVIAATAVAGTLGDVFENRLHDIGFGLSYITTLTSGASVVVQGYRSNDAAVANSTLKNVYVNLVRLIE